MKRFENEVAIVTGAGGVLGGATGRRLAGEGAVVALVDLHNVEKAAALAEQLCAAGGQAFAVQADITDTASVHAAVETVMQRAGKINLLVNLAGGPLGNGHGGCPFAEKDLGLCLDVIRLNLFGAMTVTHEVLPHMTKNGRGKIVNICSIDGLRGTKDLGKCDYAAAKAGLIGFTKSMAKELAPSFINVNAVSLGQFANGNEKTNSDPASWARYGAGSVFNRFGEPDEAAAVIAFLLSREADYVTGQNYIIGGGCYI